MRPGRWIALVVVILSGAFAWQAGFFTTSGFREVEREEAQARAKLTAVRREVDSMRALKDSLENNPTVQERVAREQWGMIREGEISFRIKVAAKADSARK